MLLTPPAFGGAQSLPHPSSGSSPPSCPHSFPPSKGFWPPGLQQPLPHVPGIWGEPRSAPAHGPRPPAAPGDFSHLQPLETPVPRFKACDGKPTESGEPRCFLFYNSQQNGQLESELNAGPQLRPKPPSRLKRQ